MEPTTHSEPLPSHADGKVAVVLAEYQQLKAEQMQRIHLRDNLIYAALTALGGLVALVTVSNGSAYYLLAAPVVCFSLGWIFVANDRIISLIREYVRGPVRARMLQIMSVDDSTMFGWEEFHRIGPTRRSSRVLRYLASLSIFVLPGLTAIGLVIAHDGKWLLLGFRLNWSMQAAVMGGMAVETIALLSVAWLLGSVDRQIGRRSDQGQHEVEAPSP